MWVEVVVELLPVIDDGALAAGLGRAKTKRPWFGDHGLRCLRRNVGAPCVSSCSYLPGGRYLLMMFAAALIASMC